MLPNWCCKTDSETQDHISIHCSYTSSVWNKVFQELNLSWNLPHSIKLCFDSILGSFPNSNSLLLWSFGQYGSREIEEILKMQKNRQNLLFLIKKKKR